MAPPRPLRVVVVDDDATARQALTALLSDDGFDVAAFGQTSEALQAVDDADVLVAERRVPDVQLVLFLREAKARHPELPVFVISAYGELGGGPGLPAPEVEALLAKPVPYEELVRRIRASRADPAD